MFRESAKHNDISVLSFGTKEDEKIFRASFGHICRHILFVDNTRSRASSFALKIWLMLTSRSLFHQWNMKAFQQALDGLVQKERFDLIHFSSSVLGFYRLPEGPPLIGDTQNVEYEVIYRTYKEATKILTKVYYGLQYRLAKSEEIAYSKKFDALLTTSQRDLETFHKDLPEKRMYVIPNGVDIDFFSPGQTEPEEHSIIFTGKMDYYPNEHGILFFLNKIFPLIADKVPDVRAYIVGAHPSKHVKGHASDRVIVTDRVSDVRPYFNRAAVIVVPLLVGGGTRIKVLEAMAMKKPVVSTSLGCEGLDLRHGHSVLLADAPQDFADAVVALFTDKRLRDSLTQNAYETVQAKYDWRAIGARLEEVFEELSAKHLRQSHRERPQPMQQGDVVTEHPKTLQ